MPNPYHDFEDDVPYDVCDDCETPWTCSGFERCARHEDELFDIPPIPLRTLRLKTLVETLTEIARTGL